MANWNITTDSVDFSVEDLTPKIPEKIELNEEEAEMYLNLFGEEEVGLPISVRKPLKECLSEFVSLGIHEKPEYADVIELASEAIDNGYEVVERDRLHVINNPGDKEVVCRYKTHGDWEFIAAIKKSLIEQFKKNKNKRTKVFGYATGFGGGSTRTYTTTSSTVVVQPNQNTWRIENK